MQYWLIKSEPETWSFADQMRDGTTAWTGVRNHQAANFLRAMRIGDRAAFYHSVSERQVVGIVEICKEAYTDPTDATGKFVCVDVRTLAPLKTPVPLQRFKDDPACADIALIRQSRLSVMPLPATIWDKHIAPNI